MTREDVLAAMQRLRDTMPQPFDSNCEMAQNEVMQLLGIRNPETIEAQLKAAGWTKRTVRLPSGRVGVAWRMPDVPGT